MRNSKSSAKNMKRMIYFQLHDVLPFSNSVLQQAYVLRSEKSLSGQRSERKNTQKFFENFRGYVILDKDSTT